MDDNTGEVFESKKSNWLAIVLIIAIVFVFLVLVIFILSLFVFTSSEDEKGSDNGNASSGSNETKQELILENCLEGFIFEGCEDLFEDSDIEGKCNSLGDLKDDCFFEASFVNQDKSFCNKIRNSDLRELCEIEAELGLE